MKQKAKIYKGKRIVIGDKNLVTKNEIHVNDIPQEDGESGGGGNTPGGGGGSDMPVIGDGKTYLYIKIAEKGRMNVPLYFSQTVANGVIIDWGDGSTPQTLSGTGNVNTAHTYADTGEYVISLNPADGCTLGLGHNSSSYCVMGSIGDVGKVYCNMLQSVEIGKNITSIDNRAFGTCYSLTNIVIPNSVTSIGNSVFSGCYSLTNIVIPESVTSIGEYAFYNCYSLTNIVILNRSISIGYYAFQNCYSLANITIPEGITNIGISTFYNCYSLASVVIPESVTTIDADVFGGCYGVAFFDFRAFKSVPTLRNASAFNGTASDCKMVVPDALYDEWKAATNWSYYRIVKASNFNA